MVEVIENLWTQAPPWALVPVIPSAWRAFPSDPCMAHSVFSVSALSSSERSMLTILSKILSPSPLYSLALPIVPHSTFHHLTWYFYLFINFFPY